MTPLAAARAEIANAIGDDERALFWAEQTIARSRARGRPKCEAIGLTARAEEVRVRFAAAEPARAFGSEA